MKKLGIWLLLLLSFFIWNLFPEATLIILKDYITLTKDIVTIVNISYSLIYMIILFLIFKKDIIRDFKKFKKDIGTNLENSFKWWLTGFFIMIISNAFILYFTPNDIAGNEQAVRDLLNTYPLYMIFSTVCFAPFVEEMIFRKNFEMVFKNKYLFILASGLTFGSLHTFSVMESFWNLFHLIPYCSLGIVLAWSYYKTRNIFTTITIHLIHNGLTLLVLILFGGISL